MEIGIFARTFSRKSLAEVLDAVAASGLRLVHFNLSCAGLPSLPVALSRSDALSIQAEFNERGLRMVGVSGTCNLIHPDLLKRREGLLRVAQLATACASLGTNLISLCTGTRDPENMWRHHPENQSAAAWNDLRSSLLELLDRTGETGVRFGIEPERANVVNSAERARLLLDEIGSSRIKIILDPANLLVPEDFPRQEQIVAKAFQILAPEIATVHAKDIDSAGVHVSAGRGVLNYRHFFQCLRLHAPQSPVILHELEETDVPRAVRFLRETASERSSERTYA